jgi:hypothetical protein
MESAHQELATAMAGPADQGELANALGVARDPFKAHLTEVVRAYGVVGYWYAAAKDAKRRARGEQKLDLQYHEDVLEAAVKTLHAGIVATQHLNKMTESFNAGA